MPRPLTEEEIRKYNESKGDGKIYIVVASGKTYPIKEDLKSWAFFWDPDKKVWINECVFGHEKYMFQNLIERGVWPGVKLEVKEKKSELEDIGL